MDIVEHVQGDDASALIPEVQNVLELVGTLDGIRLRKGPAFARMNQVLKGSRAFALSHIENRGEEASERHGGQIRRKSGWVDEQIAEEGDLVVGRRLQVFVANLHLLSLANLFVDFNLASSSFLV